MKTIKTDELFLKRVLDPYLKSSSYLKAAVVTSEASGVKINCQSWFEVLTSCYTKDNHNTGHLNLVDTNITLNQMLYYTIGISVKYKLIESLNDWSEQDFFQKKREDILIIESKTTFKHATNPTRFYGELEIVDAAQKKSNSLIIIKTKFKFGASPVEINCAGEVVYAILNANKLGSP